MHLWLDRAGGANHSDAMVYALALALAAVVAPSSAADNAIVVTGTLQSFRDAVAACRRGGCTPREDIIASIRYAEAVFRAGRYQDARRVLQDAIGRDKQAAATDPLALAALYEATATVAAHDGEQDVVGSATQARLRVLRDALPKDSAAVLQAQLDVADMHLHGGREEEALAEYQALGRRAGAAGQPTLAAVATMRQAIVAHARRREKAADALIDRVITDDSVPSSYRLAARAVAARFARERGDKGAMDTLVAAFAGSAHQGPPLLLWQPPLLKPTDAVNLNYYNQIDAITRSSDVAAFSWADIGFLIKPDGTTEPAEVLRGSGSQRWARPILSAIALRRYAPPGDNADGLYRIERWTLTFDYGTPVGSLIRRRLRNPHYEQLDLTLAPPAKATS